MGSLRSILCLSFLLTNGLVQADAPVDFVRDVRPIFHEHCVSCHGGVKQAGDLSLIRRDHVLDKRESGSPLVVPGDVQASELIRRVTTSDTAERMPPVDEHPEGLSEEEVRILTLWVQQGAEWQDHWSFVPPQRQELPNISDPGWCRQRMDNFVLSRLELTGLSPSPDASPERWLRRVSLDLTGLPPTISEREAFEQDLAQRGDAAYAAVVDRLLDSPHFGERWASMWLDQVRYADSKGLGLDGRRTIWKYRDWVIDAFNRDLPYDEFTIKQLAGDLLPDPTLNDLIATACHRTTQSNEEGGTDDEQFRVEAVVDRVNTTWQVWQGLTFGCCQCHDHPYDPFVNTEYYQFMAYFNNTADCDVNSDAPLVQAPLDVNDEQRARDLDRSLLTLAETIRQSGRDLVLDEAIWQPVQQLEIEATDGTATTVDVLNNVAEYATIGTVQTKTGFVVSIPLPEDLTQLTALRFTASPHDIAAAVVDPEWGFVLSHLKAELLVDGEEEPVGLEFAHVIGDEPEPFLDPQLSLDEESEEGFAAYSRIHYPRTAAFVLQEPLTVPDHSLLRVSLSFLMSSGGSHPLVARRGSFALSASPEWIDWSQNEELQTLRTELAELRTQRESITCVSVPVMRERIAPLSRPTNIFDRGNYLTKTEQVHAELPWSFVSDETAEAHDRLAVARWYVSPENPLTARVEVNRVWAALFGGGLVATQEDFGSSGDAPSHPRLLDDLAVRFATDMGWSHKSLLREITLSSTYRQQSTVRSDLIDRDPKNRLLARGPRHRLSAEAVRDQTLSIAGLLSEKMHGPPVHPPIPEGVWMPFDAGDKWTTAESGDEDRYRRSIYVYVKRSIPFPMFASFDTPSREFCTTRRIRSNTPLQALMTLNDTTFHEAAMALGRRMLQSHDELSRQLEFGIQLSTSRAPSADEVAELKSLYETVRPQLSESVEEDSSSITPEERAMAIVASVLLNLDEVLTN